MTDIRFLKDRVVFNGHAQSIEECDTITTVCEVLKNSSDFKTVRYENGYAEFERVGASKELKFAPDTIPAGYFTWNGEKRLVHADDLYNPDGTKKDVGVSFVEITSPSSASNGTLTQEQLDTLTASKNNKIIFDNEVYYCEDVQHDSGFLVYAHVGRDSAGNTFVKSIGITISTRGWVKVDVNIPENILDGAGTKSIEQKLNSSTTVTDLKTKNANAYALDSSIEGVAYGARAESSATFNGKASATGKRATAMGTNTLAKGAHSTAMGDNSVALGDDATTMGSSTTAQGLASVSAGVESVTRTTEWTKPSGSSGTGSGGSSGGSTGDNVRGQGAMALGVRALASGYGSMATGVGTVANGTGAHSSGVNTVAKETGSSASGSDTEANGINSSASGNSCVADGNASSANGLGTKTVDEATFGVGKYNDSAYDHDKNAIFSVGVGTGDTARSTGFVVTREGDARLKAFAYQDDSVVRYKELKEAINSAIVTTLNTGV